MIEPTQILLFAVVIVLTILVVVIGWQIYQILAEVRKILEKANTVAQGAVDVTSNMGQSLINISGVSEGLKMVLGIVKLFSGRGKEKEI